MLLKHNTTPYYVSKYCANHIAGGVTCQDATQKNIIIKIGSSNTWQYDIYNGMEFTFCTDYKLSENNTNLTILDGDIPGLTYPSTWILQKN